MDWYQQELEQIIRSLGTSEHGLAGELARARRAQVGANELPPPARETWGKIFIRQFRSPLIYLLLVAAGVVWWLDQFTDAVVIAVVLLVNAVVGAFQEGRAQNTLLALQRFAKTETTVLRDRRERVVAEAELVPGDVVLLAAGDKVPADARLLEANNLNVDESALTGESEPVEKRAQTFSAPNLPVADQRNMLFKGTYVLGGTARALVVATGPNTVLGKIAAGLKLIDTEIPLRGDIRRLSRVVIAVVLIFSSLIFGLGVAMGLGVREMFAVAVAVAVSAVPEGLPVVVTLILASGVWRMSKRQALVKRLQAVEALGQASVIALDKTGTITRNQMMVDSFRSADGKFVVTGNGYEPVGELRAAGSVIEPLNHPEVLLAGKIAVLTAAAQVRFMDKSGEWRRLFGDPTEAALLVFGLKLGFNRDDLLRESPLVLDLPFSSQTRFHGSVNLVNGKPVLYAAGAPEVILAKVKTIWRHGQAEKLTKEDEARLAEALGQIAHGGGRALALAVNFAPPERLAPGVLPELCLVGLVGLRDAIRPEARGAVAAARAAGLQVVMITGDYVETAKAIGRDTGIYQEGDGVLGGADLERLSPEALAQSLPGVTIFARVTPEHKLKIIEAYRQRGEIVAMTGDGVNDALSLTAADLGVAMGRVGTEVAKEAADIVLLDDNFESVVAAINEGRSIYWSIKRVLLYLFSTNLGEVFTVVVALLIGFKLPINASQIIWLNLVTDGFLVLVLALAPTAERLKIRRRPTHWLVDARMAFRMFLMGTVMMVGTLTLFHYYQADSFLKASTVALTVLAVFQWFNAFNCRSERDSVFAGPRLSAWWLAALAAVVLLQLGAVYTSLGQTVLRTTALAPWDWLIILAVGASVIVVEEIRKFFQRLAS